MDAKKYGIKVGSRVNHPMFGLGKIQRINESDVSIRWDNPYYRATAPVKIEEGDIVFMTKVITEEKSKMAKKMVLEFDLPDPKDSMFTSMDPMSKGTAAPLATLDGNGKPGTSWKPSMSKDPKDAPGSVKVAGGSGGKVSMGSGSKAAPVKTSAPSADKPSGSSSSSSSGGSFGEKKAPPFQKKESSESSESDSDNDTEKKNPFAKKVEEMSWNDLLSVTGNMVNETDEDEKPGRKDRKDRRGNDKKREFEKKYGKDDLEECDMNKDKEIEESDMDPMMTNEHDMASGEIAMTQELLKAILSAAVANPPDEAGMETIVKAFADASSSMGDRTLDVSDIGEIMSAIKNAAGGGDEMGGDVGGDDMNDDMNDVPPEDGEPAGDEAGEEHEGKDVLMAGQSKPLAKMSGRPGQKYTRMHHPRMESKTEKAQKLEKEKDAKGKGKKKIDEAWLSAIPNAAVIGANQSEKFNDGDDEDTALFRLIAHRAGVTFKG